MARSPKRADAQAELLTVRADQFHGFPVQRDACDDCPVLLHTTWVIQTREDARGKKEKRRKKDTATTATRSHRDPVPPPYPTAPAPRRPGAATMWAIAYARCWLAVLALPCFSVAALTESNNNATGNAHGLMMHMDGLATPSGPSGPQVSWIVLDFGRQVTLDGFRLYSHGDSINDVSNHFFQPAAPGSSTNPKMITWAAVAGTFTGAAGAGVTTPQDFAFPAAAARVWRWVVTGVHPSANCPGGECQPNVAELEFHEAGNKPGVMMLNGGTANSSLVLTAVDFNANAGGQTPANPAWKAVDGKLLYADYSEGWDANVAPASTLPSPPPVPALPTGTPQQMHYLENDLSMFIHFSICTFNDGCSGGQQNDAYQGWHPWHGNFDIIFGPFLAHFSAPPPPHIRRVLCSA